MVNNTNTTPHDERPEQPSRQKNTLTAPRLLFFANILILVPIGFGTLLVASLTDQGAFVESPGWRMLVGSLWLAILACSILGMYSPGSFLWLLVFQVIYKSVWLLAYAAPRLASGRWTEIPPGIAISFLMIVLVWPMLIPWRQMMVDAKFMKRKND